MDRVCSTTNRLPILLGVLLFIPLPNLSADEPKPANSKPTDGPVSFMKDVAPILAESCISCHNSKKAESKYNMTTFAQLAKGGQQGEGITLEPGDPDASFLVELIRADGSPRMPYKLDPLPPEKVALIERWVKEGGKYDGANPSEDWPTALRKATPISIPEAYPATVAITALAFSPDQQAIAASGYHEVTFWKTADGTLENRIQGGLGERIYELAFSPDGKWMAAASGDPGRSGSVKLWPATPHGPTPPGRDLVETTDCVFAVTFSPDSKLLAAAGADRAIRIWEVETGKQRGMIEDHADWIFDLAFSPDGARLVSASRDKTSKVFDAVKNESIVTFPAHGQSVYTASFHPDGKRIFTGGEDKLIRIWNPDAEAKQSAQIGGFAGPVFRLQFTPDGKELLACGSDKLIRVFDSANKPVRTLTGHNDWVYSFAISQDGKSVVSGSWDGEVRLWNLPGGKLEKTILAAPGYKPAGEQAAAK